MDWMTAILKDYLIHFQVPQWITSLIVGVVLRLSSYVIATIIGTVFVFLRYRQYQLRAWTVKDTVPVLFDNMFRKNGKYNFPLVQFILDRALGTSARHAVDTLILVVDGDTVETPQDLCAALEIAVWIREITGKNNVTVHSFLRGTTVSSSGYILASCAHVITVYYSTQLRLPLNPGLEEMAKIFNEDKAGNISKESKKRRAEGNTEVKLVGQEAVEVGVVDKMGSYLEFCIHELHASPTTIEDKFTYAFSDE